MSISGFNITFRLPTSLDVLATHERGAPVSESSLLARCLISVEQGGSPIDFDKLPVEVIEGVTESMADADPLADLQLNLICPDCEHGWSALFDIASFLWTEIEVWAWRMLRDVHTLAQAYGWPERDILSLSPMRRQFYLEMVGA